MRGIEGRTALVTGGCGLIGGAVARRLADEGAEVVVASRSLERAEAWIAEQSGRFHPIGLDLTVPDSIARAVDALADRGLPRIVVGAASARELLTVEGDRPTVEQFTALFGADVTGHHELAAQLVGRLPSDETASIVLLSSVYADVGVDPGLYPPGMKGTPVHYAAAKAGIGGVVRWCAAAWAPLVRVNAVIAGGVRNPSRQSDEFAARYGARSMAGRLAEADEIAAACAFLASEDASYVTGSSMVVDGGFTSW